jgi:hypothetical protein
MSNENHSEQILCRTMYYFEHFAPHLRNVCFECMGIVSSEADRPRSTPHSWESFFRKDNNLCLFFFF